MDDGETFSSVADACTAFAAGAIGEQALIRALVALPVIPQTPLPTEVWRDSWILVRGPLYDLGNAFDSGQINAALHDAALDAMIKAGHQA